MGKEQISWDSVEGRRVIKEDSPKRLAPFVKIEKDAISKTGNSIKSATARSEGKLSVVVR